MESGIDTSKPKVELDAVVVQAEGLPSAYIGDEIAFMSIKNSKYYGLDCVGTRIWTLIDQPKKVSEIIDELLKEYDVERKICVDNVLELMEKLFGEELICIVQ